MTVMQDCCACDNVLYMKSTRLRRAPAVGFINGCLYIISTRLRRALAIQEPIRSRSTVSNDVNNKNHKISLQDTIADRFCQPLALFSSSFLSSSFRPNNSATK